MITIIHGDNVTASRALLNSLKEKTTPLVLSLQQMNMTDLSQVFEGSSLFFEEKSVVIEEYLSKVKKSKEKDAILAFLSRQGENHTITFWDSKLLTKSQFSGLTHPKEQVFKLPQTLFQFLDSFSPNNSKQLLTLFSQTLTSTEPELLFYMIVRHVRILLATLSKNTTIEEMKRAQGWQLTKYHNQASKFGEEKLKKMHSQLFEIEKKQKTGNLTTNLADSIDFFLVSL